MANYDQMIYEAAIGEGFSPEAAKIVVAQGRLESSDYTSNVFQNNFNMFGMKYIGQALATRGTLAPASEVKCGGGCDSDYYAKYASPADSARDLVGRYYKITRSGIGFDDLKNVSDTTEFANKLKQRGYFGATASSYAALLTAKLLKINIVAFYNKHKAVINYTLIGALLLGVTACLYVLKKKKVILSGV